MILVDATGVDEDELTLAAAEGGAEDVERDGSSFEVTCAPEALTPSVTRSRRPGSQSTRPELTMIPTTTVEVDDEAPAKKVLRLMDELEENDDVQEVYANFDIPERVLEAVAG